MTTTFVSLVSLTLALHAPNLAYAFSMSPALHPCLHIDPPRPTPLVLSPQTDVFSPFPLLSQAMEAWRHCLVSGLCPVSCWQGSSPSPEGRLSTLFSVLISLCSFFGLAVQVGQNNPLLPVRAQPLSTTIVLQRPPPNVLPLSTDVVSSFNVFLWSCWLPLALLLPSFVNVLPSFLFFSR